MNKNVLIAGVTDQEGAYLAHHLHSHGNRVVSTTHDAQMANL